MKKNEIIKMVSDSFIIEFSNSNIDIPTLLLRLIDDISPENDYLFEFIDFYSTLEIGKFSDIFPRVEIYQIKQLDILLKVAEYLKPSSEKYGFKNEVIRFGEEIKFLKNRILIINDIIECFKIKNLEKNKILKFHDTDKRYEYSVQTLSNQIWINITKEQSENILESLEWCAFSIDTIIFFTPVCLKYSLLFFYKSRHMDYLLDFLEIAILYLNEQQKKITITALENISFYHLELSSYSQKKLFEIIN